MQHIAMGGLADAHEAIFKSPTLVVCSLKVLKLDQF